MGLKEEKYTKTFGKLTIFGIAIKITAWRALIFD